MVLGTKDEDNMKPSINDYPEKVIERFKIKIDFAPNGCWLWNSCLDVWGYGSFCIRNFRGHKSYTMKAHRMSYEIHKGIIPKGLMCCHKCDTPSCVNPEHLFLGTNQDNMDDMVRKGRREIRVGESARNVKLTEKQVLEIRRTYRKGEEGEFSQWGLARKYGVGRTAIESIIKNKSWKHI